MENLVFIHNNQLVTDSLNVAFVFGKNHADVLRDIRRVLSEVEPRWGISNFAETPYRHPQNGQEYVKYTMTEDGFTILAMGYTGSDAMRFKVHYIQAFRQMQAQLNARSLVTQFNLPTSYPEALRALAEESERNEAMQRQIEEQAPKVALYDVAMQANNAQPIGTIAKTLGIGPNKLFAFLREKKILISHGARYNQPYQEYMDRGYFEVRQYTVTHMTQGIENKTQTLVTPKGLSFIHQLLEKSHALRQPVGV